MNYPKRLIEVDLPIARISAHARREKSIRHGHISTLHIWWARRPLAACRAVILASLWPDPVDLAEWAKEADAKGEVRAPKDENLKPGEGVVIRPKRFLDEARQRMIKWSQIGLGKASNESYKLLVQVSKNPKLLDDPAALQTALLDFIADFADWDHSTDRDYLETSRALVQAAHEALGGEVGTRPMVIDPFAGGGSIPLEALRVGADAFASDLNPIPVLLNKVVLEYIPKYGQRLADEIRVRGQRIRDLSNERLRSLFPSDPDGATPIAYFWARTILSEAPGKGQLPVEVPLIRSMWLAKKKGRRRALRWKRDSEGRVLTRTVSVTYADGEERRVLQPVLEVFEPRSDSEVEAGAVARGAATCPVTGFTTPVTSVRKQLSARHGGTEDARLFCVATTTSGQTGRQYRVPTEADHDAVKRAKEMVENWSTDLISGESPIPQERFTGVEPRRIPLPQYGIQGFGHLFAARQTAVILTLVDCVRRELGTSGHDDGFELAVTTCLAFAVDRLIDQLSSIVVWAATIEVVTHTFGRQALPMAWDFVEPQPFAGSGGDFRGAIEWVAKVCEAEGDIGCKTGVAVRTSAHQQSLPDNAAQALVTDPPYYYSVPYSDLSDYFYVWLKRMIGPGYPELFATELTPKTDEAVQNLPHSEVAHLQKTRAFFEDMMRRSLSESRRVVSADGIGVVVFAHTDTAAWESLLTALVDADWMVTGSWPIDTEREARVIAQRQATLASSIHLACRPRGKRTTENAVGGLGEWRDVLRELPVRVGEWMPRLASEGVVGADAIFACLGPALEIFSRFDRVEKASGEAVTLREFLEHVWAAVSSEALSMIFKDADAAGLEPDARLTAMWLWTLGGGKQQKNGDAEAEADSDEKGDDEEANDKKPKVTGFVLEFDAARKIAQGLGINLEKSESIVEVKGDSARLLPVSERTRHLFGKDAEEDTAKTRKAKKKAKQGSLFEELDAIEAEAASTGGRFGGLEGAKPGATVLDKVHQSMILFAAGRGEALKRFLVEDGVGKDGRFWKLAQSLSALYPIGTDEKRWVDGVLARKKGLGF